MNLKYSDPSDEAAAVAELHDALALKRHYASLPPEPTVSAEFCDECDNPIPAERRAQVKTRLCTDCQAVAEAHSKRYGRHE